MNMYATRALLIAFSLLSLATAGRAQDTLVMPDTAQADGPGAITDRTELPALPESMDDRFRQMTERDPAAFRDLTRRNLSSRLIRGERDPERSADLPVELAGRTHAGDRE